jgi:hypothetical protein
MNEIISLTKQLKQNAGVGSAKQFQSDFLNYYHNLPVRKIEDIVQLENRTAIASISKQTDEFQANALLYFIIEDLVNFFSVKMTMDARQIQQTVALLREEYYHFTIEDLKLCFNNAKKGHYGKLYDRIDGAVILDWLYEYDKQRTLKFIEHNENNTPRETDSPRTCTRLSDPVSISEIAAKNLKQIWK